MGLVYVSDLHTLSLWTQISFRNGSYCYIVWSRILIVIRIQRTLSVNINSFNIVAFQTSNSELLDWNSVKWASIIKSFMQMYHRFMIYVYDNTQHGSCCKSIKDAFNFGVDLEIICWFANIWMRKSMS